MWPDFDKADLAEAVREFHRRERRFGTVGVPVPVEERMEERVGVGAG
jgi:hypothetical protein